MKEEKQEAERIICMYAEMIGKHDRFNLDIPNAENGQKTAKQFAIKHVTGIISSLSKVQESQDLSIESVRCVTKEIKYQIKVLTEVETY